jgi:hypothetical protein
MENKPEVEAKFLKKLCAGQLLVLSQSKGTHFAALAMRNAQRFVDDALIYTRAENLYPEHL